MVWEAKKVTRFPMMAEAWDCVSGPDALHSLARLVSHPKPPRRNRPMRSLTLPIVLLLNSLALANGSDGKDWPGWRGPDRTGVSAESVWNSTAVAKPLWEKQLGLGHASFAVVGDRVYTLGFDEESGQDTVYCLDMNSGAENWKYSYTADIWNFGHDGGACTTPTVVEGAVYTSNREGKVFCLDAKSGELRWKRNLQEERELVPPKWGFTASPLPLGDLVLINFGVLVALDKKTGEEVWATERDYGIAYSTPALFNLEGKEYIALLNGDGLAVLHADGGKELDFFEWIKEPQIYPMTPVIIGDRIFISGGYDRGCAMLRLADGKLEELWGSRVMRNKMSGCVLWDNHLIGFDESILKCIDLDGNMKWRKRGLGTGSMSIAGGRMVILDGKGQLIVAEANTEEYVELARQKVHEGGTSWSTPVLSHGRVFARSSLGQMVCMDNRPTQEAPVAASSAPTTSGPLPEAAALVSKHVTTVGAAKALTSVTEIHMTGPGESLRNTLEEGPVQLDWSAEYGFAWKEEGGFQLVFLEEFGWQTGRRGPEILRGEELHSAREGGTLQRLFDPMTSYSDLKTVGQVVFDNRPCYAVSAKTSNGQDRTLYFEVESGLFAGHEGDGVLMWTFADYQEYDGISLPTKWAFYEPLKGEMNSAVFDSVTINTLQEEDPFEPPASVLLFLRSPEQIAADNVRLTEEHSALLGEWKSTDGPEDAPLSSFSVNGGFLIFQQPERGPSRMNPPTENGSMSILGAEYVVFLPARDEQGVVTKIDVTMGGELQATFARP